MRKAEPGRSTRIADQIARDIAELIPKEVRDPRVGFVTRDRLRNHAGLCAREYLFHGDRF